MKNSENSFETTIGCLSCSMRLGTLFVPYWEEKNSWKRFGFLLFREMSHSVENPQKLSRRAKSFVSSKIIKVEGLR